MENTQHFMEMRSFTFYSLLCGLKQKESLVFSVTLNIVPRRAPLPLYTEALLIKRRKSDQ